MLFEDAEKEEECAPDGSRCASFILEEEGEEEEMDSGIQSASFPIHAWPKLERPREKLLAEGAATLSNAELLAIFLRTGVKGCSAVDLGRSLINSFGSLRELLSAPAEALEKVHGLGAAKIAQLQAISELVHRSLAEELKESTFFESPAAVRNYLRLLIGARQQEIFVCLYLDARHRLICAREVAHGTLTRTVVYPREIVREALQLHAASLIIAHNHPSGGVTPSEADKELTQVLHMVLKVMDIRLLDHFIVSNNKILSFSETSIMPS